MKNESNKFLNALCNAGGNPFLVETRESAEWLASYVENHEVTEILPNDDDFNFISSLLNLSPANNPQRIFRAANQNEEAVYFALTEDWELT